MPAVIFDCDGVLADTERDGHRLAFNQTFREFRLPVQWSVDDYGEKLHIGGGKERITSLLTSEFVREAGLPEDPVALQEAVSRWHKRKTEIYTAMVREGQLVGRPGIARLAREALDRGWQLGVASTSAPASVEAVLEHVVGPDVASRFDVVLAGDVIAHKKPAPDIYILALERMGVPAQDGVVIEDSRNGLLAATAAGLRVVVTVSTYTCDEDFSEACLVVTSLGDPGGEQTRVLANRSKAGPGEWIILDDLGACLDT